MRFSERPNEPDPTRTHEITHNHDQLSLCGSLVDQGTDYKFRAFLARERVAAALADGVRGMTATNFKDSVTEDWRCRAYMEVWYSMLEAQRARASRQGG